MKIKDVFKSQRAVKITILIVTALIVLGPVKLIYFFDKPKFIPEETRGKVREGVNEDVVKPLEKVIPPLAKAIERAAYQAPASGGSGSSGGQTGSGTSTVDTSNWQTYKNEKYGYELKYPEDYQINNYDSVVSIFDKKYINYQGEFPGISIKLFDSEGIPLNDWINKHKSYFIGDQDPSEVEGFYKRKSFALGDNKGLFFDWESMGVIHDYVFERNNKIVMILVNPFGDDTLISIVEKIIATYK